MSTTISITPGRTWANGETVTAAKLNCIWTDATIASSDIIPVGSIMPSFDTTAPTGYVFLAGKTLGNAASGATERANADCEELFEKLWDNLADSEAAVSGGRGASAQADFDADKTITLPDARGRAFAGLDTMSSTASANRLTSAGGVDGDVLGDTGGVETISIGAITIANQAANADIGAGANFDGVVNATGYKFSLAVTGGDARTEVNVQPTMISTFIIKL